MDAPSQCRPVANCVSESCVHSSFHANDVPVKKCKEECKESWEGVEGRVIGFFGWIVGFRLSFAADAADVAWKPLIFLCSAS